MIFVSQSYAQKDSFAIKELNQVIVTANKVEQKQSSTGKVVTVITKEQIEKSIGKSVAEILNEQAGIVINGVYSAPGTVQTVFMRGANTGRTLILLDGIPLNDPSRIDNDFDLNLFSLNDVERIEICKGAQSTLYGSDAEAGVINIITTKKDVTKPINLKATLAGGSYGTFNGNAQLYGKSNKFSYTMRFAELSTNGFPAVVDTTGKGNFKKDGYNGNETNATVQYQATNNFSLKVFALYSQYKNGLDQGAFTNDNYYNANNNYFTTGTGFKYKNDFVSLTGNYQFSQSNRKYLRDSLDKALPTYYINNSYFSKTQFVELYATIKLCDMLTLLQGADFRYGSMSNNYFSVSSYGPYSSSFNDTSISQGSMYASLLFNTKKLNIELGGRLNVNSRYGSNYTYTFNPSYSVCNHLRIFGSIASGFKAPSLYELYGGPYIGNENLQPEKSVNYEIGFQEQHKIISNRLVFFYRNINNGIDYNYITSEYFNYVGQKVKGIEYEMNVRPMKQINIAANYTLINGTESTQSRITSDDTTYHYLLRRPKSNINISVGYQSDFGLSAGVSGKYVSSAYDVGGYDMPDVLLKNYFLLNAHAAYKFNKYFTAFGNLKNITNTKYTEVYGYSTQGFNYTIGLRFSY